MKNVLFAFIVMSVATLNAQFSMFTSEEYAISNNQTFTFNNTDAATSKFGYKILNYSSNMILMKAQIVDIVGSDGSDFEICFGGSCYNSVTKGQVIPQDPVAIQAGQYQGNYDHMWNKNTSADKISYKIKFYMIDNMGAETGTPFYINYVYDKNMSVQDIKDSSDILFSNTIVKDKLHISIKENANLSIYTVDGKLVKKANLSNGDNVLYINNLKKGNYIAVVEIKGGKTKTQKIMVK